MPEGARHPQGAVGEEVAQDAFAAGGEAEELLGRFGVAELEVALHRPVVDGVGVKAEDASGRHRVQAVLVAEPVQRADLVEVEDLEVRAEESDVLVVELGFAALSVVDGDAAAHRAVRTAVGGDSGVVQALAVDLPGVGVMGLPEVPHGKAGHLVAPGEDAVGALDGPSRLLVDLADLLEVAGAEGLHTGGVGLGDGARPLDHDGLEELGAHDRADARPAARPPFQAADDGIAGHVLARLPYVQDADALSVLGVDPVVRFIGPFAPDVPGRKELDLVVLDGEKRRAVGLAFDDQRVIAGLPEVFRDPGPQVAVPVEAGQGGFGGDDRLSRVRSRDAGDGTQGHDELIIGAEGVDPRLELVVKDLDGETAAADPFLREFLAEALFLECPVGEIDPENVTCPTVHPVLRS